MSLHAKTVPPCDFATSRTMARPRPRPEPARPPGRPAHPRPQQFSDHGAGDRDGGLGLGLTIAAGQTRLLGARLTVTALAKGPATVPGGRRLLDDPKAAWRIVSGLTLAGFVAGFFALLTLNGAPPWGGRPDQLALAAPVHKVTQLRKQAEQRLRAAEVSAVVGVDDGFVATAHYDSRQVTATVSGGPAELDLARTAPTGLTPDPGRQHCCTGGSPAPPSSVP